MSERLRRTLDRLAIAATVAAWAAVIAVVPRLPPRVPTHFGIDGLPNAWGPPATAYGLVLPVTAVTILLSLVQRVPPEKRNYPIAITPRNRETVYRLGDELLVALKAALAVTMFAMVCVGLAAEVRGSAGNTLAVASSAPVVVVGALVVWYVLRMRAA